MVENHVEIKPIGGYFELAERVGEHEFPIREGAFLNTGRNALEYILRCIPDLKHVYLPYYTCEVVLETLRKLHIPYTQYSINDKLELSDNMELKEGDYLLANNYFGIKDSYILCLSEKYGDNLIVDNAQALFSPVISGIKAFYSTRKYVGVADGGIAVGVNNENVLTFDEDDSTTHDDHLLIRKRKGAEAGFHNYQMNEHKLDNLPIRRMSRQTKDILSHIDYGKVVERRRANYGILHNSFRNMNLLQLPDMNTFVCPMIYPFLSGDMTLRAKLIQNKIFVARYWPNVNEWLQSRFENILSEMMIPIPCDQRYGEKEMQTIINVIRN